MHKELLNRLSAKQLNVIKIIDRLADKERVESYLVGGIVRDILLGRENLDLDIVVEGDGLIFAGRLAKRIKSRIVSHKRFGTATLILPDHSKIDIATARKEVYEHPGALPKVTAGTIKDDVLRRDFTINALAVRLNSSQRGELVDLCGGLKDLQQKKIRVLNDLSFIEDPTRILRAARFIARFKFSLEPRTRHLLKTALKKDVFSSVKGPRLFAEVVKLLKEPDSKESIMTVDRLCGWNFISPKLTISRNTVRLLSAVDKQVKWFTRHMPGRRKLDVWLIYFMVLLDKVSLKDKRLLFERLNLKSGDRKRLISSGRVTGAKFINLLLRSSKTSQVYRLLQPLSYETMLWLKAKTPSRIIQKKIEDFLRFSNLVRISVSGKDLKEMGFQNDKGIGRLLTRLLHEKLDRRLSGRKEQLYYLRRLMTTK